jgi:elongation factor P--beta-lysine ligase
MNIALPLEPNLYAFQTHWKTASSTTNLFLSTSPESGLKKMLAKGIGDCFTISKSFRNLEGQGSLHTPEFLMLEWYRENADYKQIMKDTQELFIFVKNAIDTYSKKEKSSTLNYQGKESSLAGDWPILSMVDLFEKQTGLSFESVLQDDIMLKKAKEKGYSVTNATWGELFDQIFVNEVEPSLAKSPFFIIDFPARISPLCTPRADKPYLAERFEVYMFGMELGNGNTENTDSESVRKVFLKEKENRKKLGLFAPPIDEQFLQALKTMSSKKYGGIGLGVDRLAMIMADVPNITDVEVFYQ